MKTIKMFALAAFVSAGILKASGQTNYLTTTNVVTVTVTNTVLVTNVTVVVPVPVPIPVPVTTNETPKYPWESSAGLGLTLTKGNSDTLLTSIKLQTQKKMPGNEYSFDVDGTYGKTDGATSAESIHGFAQWNHLFTERFYGYVRTEALRDAIADIKYRVTVGPGAGYYFIKEKQTTLAGELGVGELFQELNTNKTSYTTVRVAERFEHKFNSGARVWQNVEVLPQVDRFKNYLVNAEVGIEASLSKSLTLQAYVDDNFVNQPAAGKKKNDVKLVSAVAYKF